MITTVQDNVAKLMSMEDITVIQKSVSTAYFDTKKRILVIPTWKNLTNIVIESLIGHEIGHALYTDSDAYVNACKLREPNEVFRDYLNIIEDARIESLVKQKYPGMKKIFYYGYKHIIDNKIIEIDDVEDLPIIDRLNVYFKFNGIIPLTLSKRENLFIEKIQAIDNFKQVIDIAIELFDSEKHESFDEQPSTRQIFFENESDTNDTKENPEKINTETDFDGIHNNSEKPEKPDNGDSGNNEEQESVKKEESESDSKTKKETSNKIGGSTGSKSQDDNEPSRSKTNRDLAESLSKLVDTSSMLQYVDIPSPNLDNIIYPFESIKVDFEKFNLPDLSAEDDDFDLDRNNPIKNFNKNHKANISLHKQLFEMRKKAFQYNKTLTFKTGKLDTNKLYSYKYNNEIFKTSEIKPNGKNNGLIFIMDLSGSMYSYLSGAKEKAFELILFCKQSNIPFVLYGFVDTFRNSENPKYGHNKPALFDHYVGKNEHSLGIHPNFKLYELLSSRMNSSDFKKMSSIFLNYIGKLSGQLSIDPASISGKTITNIGNYSLGGTPLTETHLCLDSLVNKFRNDTRTQIVNVVYFTDGQGTETNYINKNGSYNSFNYYSRPKIVIHDPKTKKNYDSSQESIRNSPSTILKIIKQRMTDVNVINFLITSDILCGVSADYFDKLMTDNGYTEKYINMTREKKQEAEMVLRSKYIVIEDSKRDSFDNTFLCSVNMFRKKKQPKMVDKSIQETIDTFVFSSNSKKQINTMISKFIDLIV
jgi:hypothetical protein